jgi:nucleotide-binding universal stress UspA family protein
MYRVIMVPIDGSAFSREALFQGLRIARKTNAQLRLVRVTSILGLVGGPETVALENTARAAEREGVLGDLYRLAAECRANSSIDITASVEDGPVADALCGHARRNNVDLIVMATHARRGMARVWHGSVADRLIRETRLPVIIVRPPSIATELVDGPCYKRIVVALDGSALAEKSLDAAVSLAELEHAELTLLRIVHSAKDIRVGEMHSTIGPARARDVDEAERYLASVRVRVAPRYTKLRSAVVVADDISVAIRGFAQKNNIDIIVIATHGRGGIARAVLGSVADSILSEGSLSALVINPGVTAGASVFQAADAEQTVVLG